MANRRIQSQHTKSLTFQYTNNKHAEKEIRKTISSTEAFKEKHLGINLTKQMKYLNNENNKPPNKEIELDAKRWKDHSCS
jgi:hypothetical protein